jgi:hypothetical protein
VAVIPWLTRGNHVKAQRGEWYPFSNFPMYSKFSESAYLVYITDLEDRPVAIYPTFGTWPTAIKKAYDARLKDLARELKRDSKDLTPEECRPAANAVLEQLCKESKYPDEVKKHNGYRMVVEDIWVEDGKIQQKPRMVGEIRLEKEKNP